jgi:hypothetical protein
MPDSTPPRTPGAKPADAQGKLRPTVIAAPAAKPTAAKVAERTGTVVKTCRPAATEPTAIPGVERKRLAVDLSALRKAAPASTPAVLSRTLRLLQAVVVETMTDRDTILWGHRLQQDYSELMSRTLELAQDVVLTKVTGYVGRMTNILSSVNLTAVCAAGPDQGLLSRYLKSANRQIDTPAELDAARLELDQLVKLMGASMDQLLMFKATLEKHSNRIDDIGDEVDASALAALFLSEHLRDKQPALSQRFLDRSMSLTQTVAQIRGSASMRAEQIDQPLRLIAAIQTVALVTVPGWLGSIASLGAMLQSRRIPTPTETGELAYQLKSILQQLKT